MILLIGFNGIQSNMNTNNIIEVTNLLIKMQEVTSNHLPVSHSLIPYQILLVVMHHYSKNEELSVKKLFNSGAFSEMGNRYHFRKLVEDKWIYLKDNPNDLRLKQTLPSEKLILAFSEISEKMQNILPEIFNLNPELKLQQSNIYPSN